MAFFALALTVSGHSSLATDPDTVHRLGYLTFDTPSVHAPYAAAFDKGLAEAGYIEGKNVIVERRFTTNDSSAIRNTLADLIGLRVEVLVTESTIVALAAKGATRTIPIVTFSGDPVAAGLVASLGHPGGNVTAISTLGRGITGKR